MGKPLLGVVVTHAHPDHYGGLGELTAGLDVPILATEAVDGVIRRDDDAKEQILRPMFGDEWAARRTFPNRTVRDGERVDFADLSFTVIDLGPGESPADSVWVLGEDRTVVFPGDPVYDYRHGYLADGSTSSGSPTSLGSVPSCRRTLRCTSGTADPWRRRTWPGRPDTSTRS